MNTLTFSISINFSNSSTTIIIESWFVPMDIWMIVFSLLTFIFNSLSLLIIILDKICHTVSMMLIANSCLIQFICSINRLSMIIFTLANDLQQRQYPYLSCIFQGYFACAVYALMNYFFFLQALYRYVIIVYPTFLFWQSQRTQIIVICILWILCFIYPMVFLFTDNIIYDVNNQICQVPLRLSFQMIFEALWIYTIPILIIMVIYFRLVRYVKRMNDRVTLANILSRAQRELRMIKQVIILMSILLALGTPYAVFVLMSFFTDPPKYHFRIAYIFVDASFPLIIITLFYFTDSLKTAAKKIIKRCLNVLAVHAI